MWVTAAIGMACGAGLALLAIVVTGLHFVVVFGYTELTKRLPRASGVRVVYLDGRGILRGVLKEASTRGFAVASAETQHHDRGRVALTMEVQGRGSVRDLAVALDEIEGVIEVDMADSQAG